MASNTNTSSSLPSTESGRDPSTGEPGRNKSEEKRDSAVSILAVSSTDICRIPSEDDLLRLRRVPGKIPWPAFAVTGVEMLQRLCFNGTLIVFVNFLQQPLPPNSKTGAGFDGQAGALNMGQKISTSITLSNNLWMATAPLLGAFVADQYLGRFRTIQLSNFITILGYIVLIVATLPWVIVHRLAALAPFLCGVVLLGVGYGGIKPNLPTMVVDQIPDAELRVEVGKRGERILVDPEATRSRMLLYYYGFVNLGSVVGMVAMVYAEKYVGFWLSFTIPLSVFLLCPLILLYLRTSIVRIPPSGSVVSNAVKLLLFAMKSQWSWNPITLYRNTHSPTFWPRVSPSNLTPPPPWMTFPPSWIPSLRRGLRACRLFLWYPLYWPALRQMSTNLISQASTLHLGPLPNDLLINANPLFCALLSPLYAHVLASHRVSARLRIACGFLSAALAMLVAAVIQHFIYVAAASAEISVGYQLPVYLLLANSEILAVVTGLEYAYAMAPADMRSLVMGVFYFSGAGGSAVAQGLVPVSEDPWLVWNYGVAGGLSLGGAVGVWWCGGGGKEKEEGRLEEGDGDGE